MIQAARTPEGIEVRGITLLAQVALGLTRTVNPSELNRPGAGQPLVTATEEQLASDPLLRLEVEAANASAAEKLASATRDLHDAATPILQRWAAARADWFLDRLTLSEARSLASWANRVYVDLRMAELDQHGVDVTAGQPAAVDDLLASLASPTRHGETTQDPDGDGAAEDEDVTETLSGAPMLFAAISATLGAAIIGMPL